MWKPRDHTEIGNLLLHDLCLKVPTMHVNTLRLFLHQGNCPTFTIYISCHTCHSADDITFPVWLRIRWIRQTPLILILVLKVKNLGGGGIFFSRGDLIWEVCRTIP